AAQFEPRQAFNARRGEQIAPFADGVIVEQKGLGDLLATPALVQQQDRIGPTRDPMLRQTIPRQRSQVRPFFRRQKAAPNHPLKTNPKSPATQQLSRILDDSGYTTNIVFIRGSATAPQWPSGATARSRPVDLWTTLTR